jgi:hypothetical protein
MKPIQKPTHDYIGRAPCSCVVTLIADIPGLEKEIAQEIGQMIMKNYTVERIPRDSDAFRAIIAAGIGHTCPQTTQQPLGLSL